MARRICRFLAPLLVLAAIAFAAAPAWAQATAATAAATVAGAPSSRFNGADGNDLVGRPLDISQDGHRSDFLFNVTMISVTVLFIAQGLIMLYAMMKFRESQGSRAHYDHGAGKNNLLVIGVVSSIIFVVVDVTLLVFSFRDVNGVYWQFPENDPSKVVQVEVVAQQWAWNVRYAGPDNRFNTEDDIVTLNDLRIPTDKPVHVKLKSADVIHSFYLPNFRTKQDAVPGQTTQIWFEAVKDAAKPGGAEYDIGCAQHCGSNHYKMHGTLTIYSPDEFDTWFRATSEDAKRRFDSTDVAAHWGWDWEQAAGEAQADITGAKKETK